MASETTVLILSALFPDTNGNIPPDKAAIVPDLLSHIQAMESLVQHGRGEKHKAQYRSIRDPLLSALVTDRIMELHGQMGPDWKGIACTIAQEFHETLSIDGVRGRYKTRAAQLEAHAAMSGEVFSREPSTTSPPVRTSSGPETTELPTELPVDSQKAILPASFGHFIPPPHREKGEGDGDGVRKNIPPICEPERNSPASPDSSPKDDPVPLTEAEIDSELIRLRDTGMSPKEIRDAMLHRGVDFGLVELRDRLSALARKAMQDRKDASEPEISSNCNRAELDAVMWQLWDHGKGKTPDEISDILCNNGYSYGAAMVERRLRQQGAEL